MYSVDIFRLEDKKGYGPYCAIHEGKLFDKLHEAHIADTHPGKDDFLFGDVLQIENCNHRFGFDSLDKLKQWFGEFLPKLKRKGFYIKQYKRQDYDVWISKSGRQLAFKIR